ncbi:MAG: hypothetical protein ACLSA6_09750 [Holdemania massiliensis]
MRLLAHSLEQSGTDALPLKIGMDIETIQLGRTFKIGKAGQLIGNKSPDGPGGQKTLGPLDSLRLESKRYIAPAYNHGRQFQKRCV